MKAGALQSDAAQWLGNLLDARDDKVAGAGVPELETRARELLRTANETRDDSAHCDLEHISRALAAAILPKTSTATRIRVGALIGTGSFVLGLGRAGAAELLHLLLPPVLKALADSDATVQLAAVESLFNIVRVVRQDISPHAPALLAALLRAATDSASHLDRALALLHPLLQVTVNESTTVSAEAIVAPILLGLRAPVVAAIRTALEWVLAIEPSPHLGRDLLHDHPVQSTQDKHTHTRARTHTHTHTHTHQHTHTLTRTRARTHTHRTCCHLSSYTPRLLQTRSRVLHRRSSRSYSTAPSPIYAPTSRLFGSPRCSASSMRSVAARRRRGGRLQWRGCWPSCGCGGRS